MHKGDYNFNWSNVIKKRVVVPYLMQQIKDHSIRCFTWIYCTIESSWHNVLENKNKGISMVFFIQKWTYCWNVNRLNIMYLKYVWVIIFENTRFIKGHKPSNHIRSRFKSHIYTTEWTIYHSTYHVKRYNKASTNVIYYINDKMSNTEYAEA